MTDKVSRCFCQGCGAKIELPQPREIGITAVFCSACGKVVESKPDESRLLTDKEIRERYLGSRITAVKDLLQAQDAKTYPIAFATGEKAQAEKDQQVIRILKDGHIAELAHIVSEAKKQGARELAEWIKTHSQVEHCDRETMVYFEDYIWMDKLKWQAKLKELGL